MKWLSMTGFVIVSGMLWSCAPKISLDKSKWRTIRMPEYRLSLSCPPEADFNDYADALQGDIHLDGLKRFPYGIKMMPRRTSESLAGVFYDLESRLLMISPSGLQERKRRCDPKIAMRTDYYPFNYRDDAQSLKAMIECIYLPALKSIRPLSMQYIELGGYPGVSLLYEMREFDSHIEEIYVVPLQNQKIFLAHVGYFRYLTSSDREKQQNMFFDIISTINFEE